MHSINRPGLGYFRWACRDCQPKIEQAYQLEHKNLALKLPLVTNWIIRWAVFCSGFSFFFRVVSGLSRRFLFGKWLAGNNSETEQSETNHPKLHLDQESHRCSSGPTITPQPAQERLVRPLSSRLSKLLVQYYVVGSRRGQRVDAKIFVVSSTRHGVFLCTMMPEQMFWGTHSDADEFLQEGGERLALLQALLQHREVSAQQVLQAPLTLQTRILQAASWTQPHRHVEILVLNKHVKQQIAALCLCRFFYNTLCNIRTS